MHDMKTYKHQLKSLSTFTLFYVYAISKWKKNNIYIYDGFYSYKIFYNSNI